MRRDIALILFCVFMGMVVNAAMHVELSPCSARTVAHQTLPQVTQ